MSVSAVHAALSREPRASSAAVPIAVWLFGCCALIFVMVIVGGITRLTLSGLSITEWKPVIGIVPPLSAAEWAAEFAKYQKIPEYHAVHYAMGLDEFKSIYYWEYFHRLLGRLIGLAFAVPFLWFVVRRQLPRRSVCPLAGILFLGAAQGRSAGTWSRAVSPTGSTSASTASSPISRSLWRSMPRCCGRHSELSEAPPAPGSSPGWRRAGETVLALTALTILAGGFVAGTRAGLTYNTFPLMDGRLVPAGYAQLHPFWLNWFENVAAVQFDHRVLALATFAAICLLWAGGLQSNLPKPARTALQTLLAIAVIQVALGISTLLLVVPIPLAAAHQAGAVLLLTAAINLRHCLRRPAVMDAALAAPI